MSIRISTLANGLRVATDPMDSVETASIGVWIEAGSRFETPTICGVSHFLEHMVFKGTRRRDARAIAEEIEAVGGHLNAHTSREYTAFYAKVLKEDVPLAVDIIADILQDATLDDGELGRERTVILQEIMQAQDTPDDIIFDRFQETAFPEQALGRPVLGIAGTDLGDDQRGARELHARALWSAANGAGGGGAGRSRRAGGACESGVRQAAGDRREPARTRPLSRWRLPRRARPRTGASGAGLSGRRLPRSGVLCGVGALDGTGRRHVVAGCFRRRERSGGLSTASTPFRRHSPTAVCSASTPEPERTRSSSWCR